MGSRVAIIDMGTNTFHLLVAERSSPPKIIFRDRIAVKVGQGGINNGKIMPDAAARAVKALKDFKATIDSLKVETVLAFATSAIRSASNGKTFADEIEKATGIHIRIIDGEEEAALIYAGVSSALELGSEKSLIVDVGGGSVEFIIADKDTIAWKRSFEVGGQRLLERFQKHDPIQPGEIDALNRHLGKALDDLFRQLRIYRPSVLVGVSGTFDTLSEIYCLNTGIQYFPDEPETPLTIDSFYRTCAELISKNRAARMAMPGMIEMRVDMIVVACCLIKLVVDSHPFNSIRVSTWSLKEGALMKYLASE
jgi:exopolyphosphatase/guanosine-5'-triphosphate,3'-diphosphate pyrophosphatase